MKKEDYQYRQGRSKSQYKKSAIGALIGILGILIICFILIIIL